MTDKVKAWMESHGFTLYKGDYSRVNSEGLFVVLTEEMATWAYRAMLEARHNEALVAQNSIRTFDEPLYLILANKERVEFLDAAIKEMEGAK